MVLRAVGWYSKCCYCLLIPREQLKCKDQALRKLHTPSFARTHSEPTYSLTVIPATYVRHPHACMGPSRIGQVFGNTIRQCRVNGVKIVVAPQHTICGNDIEAPTGVDDEDVSIRTPWVTVHITPG